MVIVIRSLLRRAAEPIAVSLATVATLLVISHVHGAGRSILTSAQAQPVQKQNAKGDKARLKSPMERCIATWDRATQMSKQEWKETCKRTVKENPDLYGRPY